MDLLFWTQYNPNIVIEAATKQYFDQYFYKLVLYAPGGRVIREDGIIENIIEKRKHFVNAARWQWRSTYDIENAVPKDLEILRNLARQAKDLNIKIRVEEPFVQIYAESEADLKDLVKYNLRSINKKDIRIINGPSSAEAAQAIGEGKIVRRSSNGFSYKVTIRDGSYSTEVKQGLLNYLTNLGDLVHFTKGQRKMLLNNGKYIWNMYFYTNDLSINGFVQVIHPNLVGKIHELVVVPHK
jgi:hypothetical protein